MLLEEARNFESCVGLVAHSDRHCLAGLELNEGSKGTHYGALHVAHKQHSIEMLLVCANEGASGCHVVSVDEFRR